MDVNRSNDAGRPEDVVVRKAERGWVVGDENVSDLTSAMVLADLLAADQADDGTPGPEAVDETGEPGRPGRPAAPAPRPAAGSPPAPSPRSTPSPRPGPPPQPAPSPRRAPAPRTGESGPGRVPPGLAELSGEADEAARLAVTVAQLEHALASRVRVEQAIGVLAERHRVRPREAFELLRKASRARGARVAELAQDVVASTANPLLRLPEELSRARSDQRQRASRSLRRGNGRHAATS